MSFTTYASNCRTIISEFDDIDNSDDDSSSGNYTSDDDNKNSYTVYKKILSNNSCNIVVYGIY